MTYWILILVATLPLSAGPSHAQTPEFKSGDVIFHTSSSKQSYAIMWASKSLYSHVGIVEVDGKRKYVIEAISKVSRTPLEKWLARGRLGRYAVYRDESLDDEKTEQLIQTAKRHIGKGYDIYFTSQNKEIYCSELVELAYKGIGVEVGKFQKVKDLDVDNMLVRKLVEKRWKKHPVCAKGVKSFDACWAKILDNQLVTPDSIAEDARFKKVFSNYP